MARALFVFAASLAAMGLWPRCEVAFAARAVAGFSMIWFFAVGNSTIQLGLPDDVRGRVMALWSFTFSCALGLGHLVFGLVAGALSVPTAFCAGGALLLLVAAAAGAGYRSRATT